MTTRPDADESLVSQVRRRFANVSADPFSGRRIYFENAGGTLKLKSILPVVETFTALPDNAGRDNPSSKAVDRALADGRAAVAALLGARDGQIVADQSVTGMMFRLLRTIARQVPGSNMVTTNLDHASTFDATRIICEQHGHQFRVAALDPRTGTVPAEHVAEQVDRNTVALSVIHSSNILGTRNPVAEIVRAARAIKPDLFIVLDGAQHASHGLVDVAAYGADAYVFAPYKTFAKPGISFAHISDRLAALKRDNLLGKPATAWDMGTREVASYACMSCVLEYLGWIAAARGARVDGPRDAVVKGMGMIERLEERLMRAFLHGDGRTPGLLGIPGVTVYGQTGRLAEREAIFAFNVAGHPTGPVVDYFLKHGVSLHNRVTDAYSGHTLAGLGIAECVRVSACHYNSLAEVVRFLKLLRALVHGEEAHA